MTRWQEKITAGRCSEASLVKDVEKRAIQGGTSACAAKTYLIEVDFDRLQDESERDHLKQLPTTFHLEPDDVDRLKAAAQKILANSVEFNKLIADMK
jgi:NTE family protein